MRADELKLTCYWTLARATGPQPATQTQYVDQIKGNRKGMNKHRLVYKNLLNPRLRIKISPVIVKRTLSGNNENEVYNVIRIRTEELVVLH